jgi:hypothetical protein
MRLLLLLLLLGFLFFLSFFFLSTPHYHFNEHSVSESGCVSTPEGLGNTCSVGSFRKNLP